MIAAARRAYDRFAGRGEAAVTVPAMDGALRPNTALEEAELVLAVPAPDSLVAHRGAVLVSTGAELRPLPGQAGDGAAIGFDAEITCAASGPGDALAVGLGDGRIVLLDGHGRAADRRAARRAGGLPAPPPSPSRAGTSSCATGPPGTIRAAGSTI